MLLKRILVVDDDNDIRNLLIKLLSQNNYNVYEANNGTLAVDMVIRDNFDLIILDIMLEDMDGFEVLKEIRDKNMSLPVIFLSARGDDYSKVLGFGLGADDYIIKPFSSAELIARVNARINRSAVHTNNNLKQDLLICDPFELDLRTYTLKKRNKVIELSAKELNLMKFFMENPNQVFTKKQIYRNIWNDDFINDFSDENSVMVYISKLRDKIEDNPKVPKLIQTVWGIGYKFIKNNLDISKEEE